MDKLLRELQRAAAAGDPEAMRRYLHNIARDPDMYREIEMRARWAQQEYVHLYIQLLDIKGEVDLKNLWVCPYAYRPSYFDYNRSDPILTCFPYKLGDNHESMMAELSNLQEIFALYPEDYELTINAYVVDIRDLELADKVEHSMNNHLTNVNEDDYAVYLLSPWTAASFYVLQGAAVLEITPKGVHIPDYHDISLPPPRRRRTRRFFERVNHTPDPFYPFPRREANSIMIGQPALRNHDEPYVVMVHMPSFRGFTLHGGYGLLHENVGVGLIVHAMRYNQQVDYGYDGGHPWPEWTKGLPRNEFVGYWIAN